MKKASLTALFAAATLAGCATQTSRQTQKLVIDRENCTVAETFLLSAETTRKPATELEKAIGGKKITEREAYIISNTVDFKQKLLSQYVEPETPCAAWISAPGCSGYGATMPFAQLPDNGKAIIARNAKRLPASCSK